MAAEFSSLLLLLLDRHSFGPADESTWPIMTTHNHIGRRLARAKTSARNKASSRTGEAESFGEPAGGSRV